MRSPFEIDMENHIQIMCHRPGAVSIFQKGCKTFVYMAFRGVNNQRVGLQKREL